MGVTLTYPFSLADGTLADATQVMANFNAVISALAASAAASGANSDITSLSGLTSPIAPAGGGTVVYVASTASGGSANAQTIPTMVPTGFALTKGNIIVSNPGFTNTGALQINPNGLGLNTVLKQSVGGLVALTGGEVVLNQYALYLWDGTQFELINPAPGPEFGTLTNLASAATTDLGTVPYHDVNVTGTTTITSFGSSANTSNPIYLVTFAGILTLTYNVSSLILPGAANITTAANDFALMEYLGSGNWRCIEYFPASGQPAVAIAGTSMATGKILIASGTLSGASVDIAIPNDAQEVEIELNAPTIASGSAALNVTYKVGGTAQTTGYCQGTIQVSSSTVSGASSVANSSWGIDGAAVLFTANQGNISIKLTGMQSGSTKGMSAVIQANSSFALFESGANSSNTGLVSDIVLATGSSTFNGGAYRVYKIK